MPACEGNVVRAEGAADPTRIAGKQLGTEYRCRLIEGKDATLEAKSEARNDRRLGETGHYRRFFAIEDKRRKRGAGLTRNGRSEPFIERRERCWADDFGVHIKPLGRKRHEPVRLRANRRLDVV